MYNAKLSECLAITSYAAATAGAPTEIGWIPIQGYDSALAIFVNTLGTDAIEAFKIVGNPALDGSGTDIILKTSTTIAAADAVGDTLVLELSQADLDANPTVKAITVLYDQAASNAGGITLIRGSASSKKTGLTVEAQA